MSATDLTHPPTELAAFFELRDWEGMAEGERRLVAEIADICRKAGRADAFGADGVGVRPLKDIEREAIDRAMRLTGGSASRASKLLGIGRATLYRRLAGEEGEGVGAGARAQGAEP